MKKFTQIEERLLKEAAEAKELFNNNIEKSISKLEEIKTKLEKVSENLDYTNIMGKVNEDLEKILSTLPEDETKEE